jgi:hypothetical protein
MNLNELLKKYYLLENEQATFWPENLDAIGDHINDKIENSCKLIQAFEQRASIVTEEIERLKGLKKSLENRAVGIKNWLTYCLGGENTETELYRLQFRKSEAVEIVDESAIPPQYLREKVTVTPAKDEIKADLKAGATIPGATLKKNISLTIK